MAGGDDVAGAVPRSGVEVQGVRLLLDTYDKDATFLYTIYWYLAPWETSQRWRITASDADSRTVARRGELRWRAQAERVRGRFVAAASELDERALAQVDWQWLLDSISSKKRSTR